MILKKTSNLVLCALTLSTIGCTSDPYNQGNYVEIAQLKGKEGVWTRVDVENTVGSPSFVDPNNANVVYYVGSSGVKYPLMSASIEKSATIRLEYDREGKLVNVHSLKRPECKGCGN